MFQDIMKRSTHFTHTPNPTLNPKIFEKILNLKFPIMSKPVQIVSSDCISSGSSVDSNVDFNSDSNSSSQAIADTANTADVLPDILLEKKSGQTEETTVSSYFDALNAGDFQTVASLFAEEGALYPPFDGAVTGREAIVTYLEAEAKGLQLTPKQCITQLLDDGTHQCRVIGKVQTPLFGVSVGWTFVLNANAEILLVQVKLLAALEELLKLQSKS